ncbi:MAG TPA: ribonuclease HI [Herpetosiphonaceae bacterium]
MTTELREVTILTDGACIGNPGPGGYGVVPKFGERTKELSGGFRLMTNNRMELIAVIKGLRALKERCIVSVFSDSEYVVEAMTKGWPARWRANGWMRTKKDRAVNPDLWQLLLEVVAHHQVTFSWVKGYAGHPENERCDQLALAAAQGRDLPVDDGYEHPASVLPITGSLFD